MALTLKGQLDIFMREPISTYCELGANKADPFSYIHVFKFELDKIHPDDQEIIIPNFINKEDIPYFHGQVSIENNVVNISVSMNEIILTTKFNVFIRKTSEESIRLFKEGEVKKNATESDKLD